MITILEVVRRSTEHLERRGIPNPKPDAEWIVAHSLGLGRMDLYLQFERPLTEGELEPMRGLLRRRANREPLQYVLGETDFAGLRLTCDRRALIPRPETERLFEILTSEQDVEPRRILDLGVGSGALALALARFHPEAKVTATDASEDALSLAKENAAANDLAERVRWFHGDWLDALREDEEVFDLIVSNPPYLTESEWAEADPEVRGHEPKGALVAEDEGAAHLLHLLAQAPKRLAPGGLLALETGVGHHGRLKEAAGRAGYADVQALLDLSGRPRFFLARMN